MKNPTTSGARARRASSIGVSRLRIPGSCSAIGTAAVDHRLQRPQLVLEGAASRPRLREQRPQRGQRRAQLARGRAELGDRRAAPRRSARAPSGVAAESRSIVSCAEARPGPIAAAVRRSSDWWRAAASSAVARRSALAPRSCGSRASAPTTVRPSVTICSSACWSAVTSPSRSAVSPSAPGAEVQRAGDVGAALAGGEVDVGEQPPGLGARLRVQRRDGEVEVDRLVRVARAERRAVGQLGPVALGQVDEPVDRADVRGQPDVGEGALAQLEVRVDRHPHLGQAVVREADRLDLRRRSPRPP